MNENKHYKLEKKLKQVKTNVPTAFSAKVDETLLNFSSKKKRMMLTVWSSTAAIAIVSVLMVSSMLSPTFAKSIQQIPVVGSVFHLGGEKGLKGSNQNNSNAAGEMITADSKESKQNNANIVGKEISSPSSTLKITDVVYDGLRLSISYIQELHDDNSKMIDLEDMIFKADGKLLDEGGESGDYLNKNKYAGTISFSRHIPKEDVFTLTLNVEQLGNEKGNWSMELPVTKQASGETYVNKQEIETDLFSLHMKTIKVSPMTVQLDMRTTESIEDNKEPFSVFSEIEFKLLDENGLEFERLGISGMVRGSGMTANEGDHVNHIRAQFKPQGDLPKVATLQLIKNNNERITEPVDEQQLPLKLAHEGVDLITIEKIEHEEGSTVVTYRAFGSNTSLSFTDESGKGYFSKSQPEQINNKENLYQQRFERFPREEKMNAATWLSMSEPTIVGEMKLPLDGSSN